MVSAGFATCLGFVACTMEPVDVTEAARIQAKADAKSSRVADLVAKKVAAVDCEDFEEAARLKEELNAARAEALAAWQAEQAEVLDQVEKSKTALDVAEESLSVAKQALSVEEVALKEVNALLKQNMAAIKAAVKEEDFTKAAELKDVAGVDLGGRLAAAKEAVAAKKETLAAAKEARAKALTELTDTMLKLDDGKMPKAAKPASRRRPSMAWLKPGGKDVAAGDAGPSEGAAAGDADAPPSKASGLRRPSMAWLKPGGKDVAAGDAEPAEGASAGDADAPPSKASGLRRPSVEVSRPLTQLILSAPLTMHTPRHRRLTFRVASRAQRPSPQATLRPSRRAPRTRVARSRRSASGAAAGRCDPPPVRRAHRKGRFGRCATQRRRSSPR